MKFCSKYNIHFISDEVYALSRFSNPEIKKPQPFVSVLSLPLDDIGIDKSLVHAVWSTSKDFGQSGFRMVSLTKIAPIIEQTLNLLFRAAQSPNSTRKWP